MANRKLNKEDKGTSNSILYPFLDDGFSKGVLIFLVPATIACVISRAPQYRLESVLGQDLPISLDAISLILVAPIYSIFAAWLLLRLAKRSPATNENWTQTDISAMRGAVVFLGITALFLLIQFFVVLAPVGTCDQRPHMEFLWTFDTSMIQVQHCMSTAEEINKTAWFYLQPIVLQAWANILLTGLSLRILWKAWKIWAFKRTPN